ncbi:MAG: hypothetical protein ACRCUY_13195, partial [Thermoguttaceae bacterium]
HFPKEWYVKSGRTDEVDEKGKSKRFYPQTVNKIDAPYESFWGGTSLDMTRPDVQNYLRDCTKRIADDWGFNYFKLDGLWTGMACDQLYINNEYIADDFGEAIYDDATKTPVEAYCTGLDIIRKAAPEAFILGCNVSQNMRMMLPSAGFVDAMRVGPDNGADWNSLKRGPWHGSNRYFMNGRIWWNDPDPVYVRNSMPFEHARLIVTWVSITGQLFAMSDWLPNLSDDRLEILRRTLAPHGLKTVRPIDLFREDLPKIWHLTDQKQGELRRDVVALFNWNDKESANISFKPSDLVPNKETNSQSDAGMVQYVTYNFWENIPGVVFSEPAEISVAIPPADCKVFAIRKITDENAIPQVISTSGHITQGIIDLSDEKWDAATNTLSGTSKVVANDPYTLQIYLPAGFGDGKNADVKTSTGKSNLQLISMSDQSSQKVMQEHKAGWIAVTLETPDSTEIKWEVTIPKTK